MDFSFSEQHVAVRDTVRRLCRSEHQRLVAAAEENEALPRDVFARWGELGLLGVRYPESDGGSGLDKIDRLLVGEGHQCRQHTDAAHDDSFPGFANLAYRDLVAEDLGIGPLVGGRLNDRMGQ